MPFFLRCALHFLFFLFNDTATTEIYTLSLHDALPIFERAIRALGDPLDVIDRRRIELRRVRDRKSTRLNSSHITISYAVFCLKKKSVRRPRLTARNSPDLIAS